MNNEIKALVEAMNENNNLRKDDSPYAGYEITETRRKFHLLNSILTNGQRSGLFLIDVNTGDVHKSLAYGKAGRKIGTVASLLAEYLDANKTVAAVKRAKEIGQQAFTNGLKCVPAQDKQFDDFLREINGTVKATFLLDGWHRGWAEANVAAPVEAN